MANTTTTIQITAAGPQYESAFDLSSSRAIAYVDLNAAKGNQSGFAWHVHKFANTWKSDVAGHWKECACGEIVQLGGHRHSGPCDDACNVCGYVREEYHAWVAGKCKYCGAKDPNYVPPQVPEEQPATDPTEATTQPTVAPTDPTSPTAPTEPDIPKESGDAQHTLWLILVLVVVAVAAVLTVILLRKKT